MPGAYDQHQLPVSETTRQSRNADPGAGGHAIPWAPCYYIAGAGLAVHQGDRFLRRAAQDSKWSLVGGWLVVGCPISRRSGMGQHDSS